MKQVRIEVTLSGSHEVRFHARDVEVWGSYIYIDDSLYPNIDIIKDGGPGENYRFHGETFAYIHFKPVIVEVTD